MANEPGLGKSRSAIDATAGMERVLVVAPSLILEAGVWHDEITKWGEDSNCEYTLASYSMLNERKPTGNKTGTKPIHRLREQFRGRWDALIIDEAHYVKGRKSSWTWATQQIARNSDVILPMTGTPIPNWAHECFSILQLLHPEESSPGGKYGSFWRWAGEWFDTSPNRFSNGNPVVGESKNCNAACRRRDSNDPCEHYQLFTLDNFGNRWRRVLRADCLDLPPFTEQRVNVPFTPAGRRAYRDLKKKFATEYEGTDILAWSQGMKNVLLDQITVSPWFLTQEGEPHGGKLDMLRFDLEGRTRPTFVVAHYRVVVEACARVAESTGARVGFIHGGNKSQHANVLRAFKEGRLDVLVGSIETVAEGLTLTQADLCIFVEKSFKPYRNEQAIYRIYRIGQEHPVTIRDYVCPDSVDNKKRHRLATKQDQQDRIMTAAEFTALL